MSVCLLQGDLTFMNNLSKALVAPGSNMLKSSRAAELIAILDAYAN